MQNIYYFLIFCLKGGDERIELFQLMICLCNCNSVDGVNYYLKEVLLMSVVTTNPENELERTLSVE